MLKILWHQFECLDDIEFLNNEYDPSVNEYISLYNEFRSSLGLENNITSGYFICIDEDSLFVKKNLSKSSPVYIDVAKMMGIIRDSKIDSLLKRYTFICIS